MTKTEMKLGGRYNWKGQPERLVYVGFIRDHLTCPGWFQFAPVDNPNDIWCEVREADLGMLEETKQ